MFVGREQELANLDRLNQSGKFELLVLYGRKRVGKTALLTHYLEKQEGIYFVGVESGLKQNLVNFSSAIWQYCGSGTTKTVFGDFRAALEFVFQQSLEKRLILVIDEYPYLARSNHGIATILQTTIDKYRDRSKLFLVLCGSSVPFMENQVLEYKAPLFGRRTAQMKILPFSYAETFRFLADFSLHDRFSLYAMLGGIPQYLQLADPKKNLADNIKSIFLDRTAYLYEEPLNLLKQEMHEIGNYLAIAEVIAKGVNRLEEIGDKAGISNDVCTICVRHLLRSGIVKKIVPYGERTSKRALYYLTDNLFAFWFRFVLPNIQLLARNRVDLVYQHINSCLDDYLGMIFRKVCREYLWRQLLMGKCAVQFGNLGGCWGTDKKTKLQLELDIIGTGNDEALFGECIWQNAPVEQKVLQNLLVKTAMLKYGKKYYYLFAKNGFSPACRDLANSMGNISLVEFKEMF